jgi:hypothetical protein
MFIFLAVLDYAKKHQRKYKKDDQRTDHGTDHKEIKK